MSRGVSLADVPAVLPGPVYHEVPGPFSTMMRVDAAGHLRDLEVGDLRVNLFRPGLHDRPTEGIWLRRRTGHDAEAVHLTGSADGFAASAQGAVWSGTALGVGWSARLAPTTAQAGWQWDIDLEPSGPQGNSSQFDLVLVQDVALAPTAAVRTNELYVSHYLTHQLLAGPASDSDIVVASRQTMATAPQLPLLVTHWAGGARAASTDAFDLGGVSSRRTGEPAWMVLWDWPTRVRQYEHAQVALASIPFSLHEPRRMTALLRVVADHRGPMAEAVGLLGEPDAGEPIAPARGPRPTSLLGTASPLHGDRDAAAPGPHALFVERDDTGPLSWFGPSSHSIAGRKEDLVERSHGHILVSAARLDPAVPVLCATTFAPGVFCSHVALGNTNFHRVIDVHRDSLNHLRSSGVRLLVDAGDGPRLLAIPSQLDLSWGSATWTYRWEGREIRVTTTMGSGEPIVRVRLTASEPVRVLATVSLDADTGPWRVSRSGAHLTVVPGDGHVSAAVEPRLAYAMACDGEWDNDHALWSDDHARSHTLFVARSQTGRHFTLTIAASQSGPQHAAAQVAAMASTQCWEDEARAGHAAFTDEVLGGLSLSGGGARWAEVGVMLPWLAHDAVVHLLSPHGLEQFSGAAWGTRDVCQGPLELALACGHPDVARDLLLRVFAHQFPTGDFPQWFMFDGYPQHQEDSHGDVPVWPLIALSEYLAASGDTGVLRERVGWLPRPGDNGTNLVGASMEQHVGRILDHVESHLVLGTGLYAFGEGDWDDTLQPADAAARSGMVSSWTVGLLVEACESLAPEVAAAAPGLAHRIERLGTTSREAFGSQLVVDGIVAGLAHFGDGPPEYLLHPRDRRTGQHYRLISITQALLADLLSPSEAALALDAVRDHLSFVDGVRLMDRPMPWDEGVPHVFRRGEQSAFFGREVGLMYTHAHLRWVQALVHLHDPFALDELLLAVPVQLSERLGPVALPRQRNCYYSSSDAQFLNRVESSERWDDLRRERVPVAGGWRVYSSGPGIMVRLIARDILGVHREPERIVLDPNLPADVHDVAFGIRFEGRSLRVHYLVDLAPAAGVRVEGAPWEPVGRAVALPLRSLPTGGEIIVRLPARQRSAVKRPAAQ